MRDTLENGAALPRIWINIPVNKQVTYKLDFFLMIKKNNKCKSNAFADSYLILNSLKCLLDETYASPMHL
jgi:hypothetical protein